ncbi:MFS transporter [Acinetobacter towneri]|uniref:MFS transporter n=1 Tax=Acinetobacter towneri TaxID=202956 RepID=UPI003AF16AD2
MSSSSSIADGSQRLWNRSFILCVCNNLFLFIYYFALLTILPIYIMKDLGGTVKEAGLALTLFLISSIAIRPFSGLIVERLGKKFSFRGSELFFVLFAFSYLWIDSMWSLLLVRFLHGIWFSILTTVAVPVANDFIPEQRKGEGMGYFVMSTNLGVVFGPLLALTVVQFSSFQVLFAILCIIMCIGFVFCWLLDVKDTTATEQPPASIEQASRTTSKSLGLSWHDLIETKVIPVSLVALLTALAYSSIMSFITAYSESKNLLAYTSVFFVVFAVSMIAVRPWVGRLYDRRGPSSVIYPSLLFFAIGLAIVSFLSNQWVLWLSAVFIGIGYGSVFPCLQTVAIQSVSKQRMGHAISTFFTLFDLGMAIGSVLMGVLIAWYGYSLTYMLCALITLLTLVLYKLMVVPTLAKKKA